MQYALRLVITFTLSKLIQYVLEHGIRATIWYLISVFKAGYIYTSNIALKTTVDKR